MLSDALLAKGRTEPFDSKASPTSRNADCDLGKVLPGARTPAGSWLKRRLPDSPECAANEPQSPSDAVESLSGRERRCGGGGLRVGRWGPVQAKQCCSLISPSRMRRCRIGTIGTTCGAGSSAVSGERWSMLRWSLFSRGQRR